MQTMRWKWVGAVTAVCTAATVRNNQCKACPWRVSVTPNKDIPGGYCSTKHTALKSTFAEPGIFNNGPAMACHESPPGNEQYCVGWVANQLGPGNNIGLRIRAMDGRFRNLRTDGPQPKKNRKR